MQVINHERINGIYKCVVNYKGEVYTRREERGKVSWDGPFDELEKVFNSEEKKY